MRFALTLSLLLLCGPRAAASGAAGAFSELHHTAWGPRQGLIGRGFALAQTQDGFLWIGTADGLYRFDGMTFEKYQPLRGELPVGTVRSLLATDDGSLWIGFLDSRISRLNKGEVSNFGPSDGIPVGGVRFMVSDGQGGFFSSATGGIIHFDGHRFEKVRKNWSLPLLAADCALLDSSGTLWITSEGNTFYLLRGEHAFRDTKLHTGRVMEIVEDRERIGLVAEYNADKLFWIARPVTKPAELPYSSRSQYLMIDHDGAAWIGAEPGGLHRARNSNSLQLAFDSEFHRGVESLTVRDGLSSDVSLALLMDREGNIWSLTDRGLDRFREANAVDVQIPAGYYTMTLAVGPDQEIWGGPWETAKKVEMTWVRLRDGRRAGHVFDRIANVAQAENDVIYFNSQDRDLTVHGKPDGAMWVWSKTGVRKIARPPGLDTFRITSMAVDGLQRVWVQVSAGGEWIYHPSGTWEHRNQPVLDRMHPKFFTSKEAEDFVYLLYPTGLFVSEHDRLRPLLKNVPPGIRLAEMAVCNGAVFVGTDHGIFIVRGERLERLPLEIEGPPLYVQQMISSEQSGLWIVTSRNIVHLNPAQLSQIVAASGFAVQPEIFDLLSDLPEPLNQQPRSAVEGPDGVLWFPSLSHVVRIDPKNIRHNTLPPAVVISHLMLGNKILDPLHAFRVPPGNLELRFEYTATSLSVAEKIRFRYRLEGLQENWTDGGSRREAVFLGLPPGKYTFHVIASNNDGVWNSEGASVAFEVLPRYYQTLWFKSLVGAVALLLVYVAFVVRTRKIAESIRLRAEARESERQRIARELHDDFFPGLYGLFLSIGSATSTLSQTDEAKGRLETTLESADQVMNHGRELVLQLRKEQPVQMDLVNDLVDFGRKQEVIHGMPFHHSVRGTRPALSQDIQKELLAIGREALWNAFRHSKADEIELEIEFLDQRTILRIRDNGVGISSTVVKLGRDGHMGLHSMRERAASIGAEIAFQPNGQRGTIVVVTLDPKRASRRRNTSTDTDERLV